jgi:hypothetical protein
MSLFVEWRQALSNRNFVFSLILSLIGVTAFASVLPYYFINILLPKPGSPISDPVLNFFTPRDWSIEIFVGIYLATVLSLVFNSTKPYTILVGLQTYVIVNFMRLTSLYLFTLEAPDGIIPLSDPFLTKFAYGQAIFVKDLFFSGHISTLAILFFIENKRVLKWFILISMIAVAVMLAWQRVHYSIDMLAAPLITWIVFRLFTRLNRLTIKNYHHEPASLT